MVSPLSPYNKHNLTCKVRPTSAPQVVGSSTGSEESFAIADWWLQDCSVNHKTCNDLRSSTIRESLPTRLIHVGHRKYGLAPRLCLSRSLTLETQYTTLSDCWGEKPIFRLLKSNINTLRLQLPFSELLLTFTNAMEITSWMGINYI
jgi:hypothetical protein